MVLEIARRFVNGEWKTTALEDDGGGGAQPGVAVVRGPFPFAFDTSGLLTGLAIGYTPAIGDVLLDAWFQITAAWNGTTPKGDLGFFVGTHSGFFSFGFDAVDMTSASSENPPGLLNNISAGSPGEVLSQSGFLQLPAIVPRVVPGKFAAANPLKVCVSQDGSNIGADPGSTLGAAALYLVTATPTS